MHNVEDNLQNCFYCHLLQQTENVCNVKVLVSVLINFNKCTLTCLMKMNEYNNINMRTNLYLNSNWPNESHCSRTDHI